MPARLCGPHLSLSAPPLAEWQCIFSRASRTNLSLPPICRAKREHHVCTSSEVATGRLQRAVLHSAMLSTAAAFGGSLA